MKEDGQSESEKNKEDLKIVKQKSLLKNQNLLGGRSDSRMMILGNDECDGNFYETTEEISDENSSLTLGEQEQLQENTNTNENDAENSDSILE